VKVLHVIPSLSLAHGGPSLALPVMARGLAKRSVEVDVATTDDDGPRRRMSVALGTRLAQDGFGVIYFRKQTEFYKFSKPLGLWLKENVSKYNLIHIHALFSYSSFAAARAARACGVPYIVRPLGSLNRWGVQNRRPLLKSLSLKFVERPLLKHAVAVHYTSTQEQIEAQEAGATAPGFVLPLDIQPEKYQRLPDPRVFFEKFPERTGRKIILFLSRIDPKKGIELLLRAFPKIRAFHSDALLVIAGSGDVSYLARLKKLAHELRIEDAVLCTGFLQGELKLAAFAAATCYVLPSYSENFGIAFAEALAAGLPSIGCHGVAVAQQAAAADAACLVDSTSEAISAELSRVLRDEQFRQRLGANARRFVQLHFSSEAVGSAVLEQYRRILTQNTVAAAVSRRTLAVSEISAD
jgi:glycosyltransferase involved in cell wall biosynthesis